ncbi:hypothetical protein MHB_0003475 [Pseudomonas fluorescens BBc6R8]|uniref:hypothetical protein n=1 Tax=Pseudomonas fluorescens TaxID=294 RepID=UPI000281CA2F|nr:hypothetical protein [Pseudomonas fluorescens]QQD55350.1 hypothetical protein MHB_0003475 [Pseudomonas fluorescens BBc6R8]
MSKLEIFRKQQALRASVGNRPLIHSAVSPEAVAQILSAEPDYVRLSSFSYFEAISLTAADHSDEALRLIEQLEQGFDAARLDDMLQKCQRDVIGAIAGPLGLGKVLAVHDKVGGNVTTIHNAKQKIYARTEEEYNRTEYTKRPNSEGHKFEGAKDKSVGSIFTRSQLDEEKHLIDGYTNERIKGSESSPDHITSNSTFHKNGGFMLSGTRKADFATDTDNLISTRREINESMKDHDKREWADRKSNGRKITNEDNFDIKKPQLEAAVQRGEKAAEKHGPSLSEKAEFYTKNAAATGVNEGLKMGTQQAFGLLMVEIFSSALEEIKDVYKNGQQSESVLEELSIRLKRLGTRIASKWKDMIEGFSGGFISGFISNALTMLINMFVTTGKRAVRMIREGVFSLLKAMKMMVFPPENQTFAQVAHEALKLLAVGGVVIGGVALEEMVEKLIMSVPLLVPIAPMLTAVLVGAITALCMTFVCYLIDKMDLLGVIKAERNKAIISGLNTEFDAKVTRSYAIIEDIEKYLLEA